MKKAYQLYPIGLINKTDEKTHIQIYDDYLDALLGLESFSHIYVFYWFHQNDIPEKRNILRVHPKKRQQNPLTGVFATHSPVRPNLVAMTLCKIIRIESDLIQIEDIDAYNNSPVIDIKCYIPPDDPLQDIELPDWVR